MNESRGPTPLSLLLREGTESKHRLVEEAPFVRALLCGRIERAVYARFVQSLYVVYAEMEGALDRQRGHPVVSQLDLRELRRLPSLEVDLAWWNGHGSTVSYVPSPATRRYRDRIREVAESAPGLLVAHLYTRYLGDLSGGPLLARAVERAFGLADGAGVSFYRFGGHGVRARLKEALRARLDAVRVEAAGAAPIVAEACRAFDHNRALFDELVPPDG